MSITCLRLDLKAQWEVAEVATLETLALVFKVRVLAPHPVNLVSSSNGHDT